jgi:hypothetical protein
MPEGQLVGGRRLYGLALLREPGQPQNQASGALVFGEVPLAPRGLEEEPDHARLEHGRSLLRIPAEPGSERHKTYSMYRKGMLVSEVLAKGGRLSHLKRDIQYGHISVTK